MNALIFTRIRQQGAVLIIAMILLAITTLIAVSSFKMGQTNQQIVGNSEIQQQTFALTQAALEEAISSNLLFESQRVFYCGSAPNTRCWTMPSGDQITVALTPNPACIIVSPLANNDIEATDATLQGCLRGGQPSAVEGGTTGEESLCSRSLWDIRARGEYLQNGIRAGQVEMRQGIQVVVSNNAILTACPP
ncbi:MAG: hypothetical protein MZV65_01410 [Chromatiales bacterium]|nr:hypothetical protein [Chromatiales bacterium]